jgi:hypothetical protein
VGLQRDFVHVTTLRHPTFSCYVAFLSVVSLPPKKGTLPLSTQLATSPLCRGILYTADTIHSQSSFVRFWADSTQALCGYRGTSAAFLCKYRFSEFRNISSPKVAKIYHGGMVSRTVVFSAASIITLWDTENPVKSHETTGHFTTRATCSATPSPYRAL